MSELLPRHHLVWLDALSWPDAVRHQGGCKIPPEVECWFAKGLPAVARRHMAGEAGQGIALGIPLPPREGKRRIAITADRIAVLEIRPPLLLSLAIPSAPPSWQSPLLDLDRRMSSSGLAVRVYGSLAWQHLAGESYVTPQSDVDLLIEPASRIQLMQALGCLAGWEKQTGLRADGEILLPDGVAVAWRELLNAQGRVLVKSASAVVLADLSEVLNSLDRQQAVA